MKLILCVAALVAIAFAKPTCNTACQSNGECSNTACTFCQGGGGSAPGTCVDGGKCGTTCVINTDCSSSCSLCATCAPSYTNHTCQPDCGQTCSTSSECNGNGSRPYGCGNCVKGQCSKGKFCGNTCAADAECGTYTFPYCTKCLSGKCSGACGTMCASDGACDSNSTCPRCASGICSAAQACGGACMVDQDCGSRATAPCWACVTGKCTKLPLVV